MIPQLKYNLTSFSEKVSAILEEEADRRGFRDPRWITETQANSFGGRAWTPKTCFRQQGRINGLAGVKHGELPVEIKRWIPITDEDGQTRYIPAKKPLFYFNVEQCYGVVQEWTDPSRNGQLILLKGVLPTLEEIMPRLDEDAEAEFERMLIEMMDEEEEGF